MAIRAILMDLDGTLVDSMAFLYGVYERFLAHYGIKGTQEEFNLLVGPSLKEAAEILRNRYSLPESTLYQEMALEGYSKLPLNKEAVEFLEYAKGEGMRSALVTSAPKVFVDTLLSHHDLHFDAILTGDDVPHGKPDPALYQLALKRLQVDPEEVIAIEDSPNGIQAALSAGILAVWIFQETFQIRQVLTKKVYPQDVVDGIWEKESKKRPLFDGKIYSLLSREGTDLIVEALPYKAYIAQLKDKTLPSICPVGVSGIVHAEGKVLFATRSLSVTQFPGYEELAPSGSLSEEDYREQLLTELEEETGIPRSLVLHVNPLALIAGDGIDICAEIALKTLPAIKMSHEHTTLHFVDRADLDAFINNPNHRFVPTSLALLTIARKRGIV